MLHQQKLPRYPIACTNCDLVVRPEAVLCMRCERQVSCPNVRMADRPDERDALQERFETARRLAGRQHRSRALDEFVSAVESSVVVIARSISTLDSLTRSENFTMVSFYRDISSGGRRPEDNFWDKNRVIVENYINPLYYENLVYGALSLDSGGVPGYGAFAMTLRTADIVHRTSFFERNPFQFVEEHPINLSSGPPLGYRATWEDRSLLAGAKLAGKVTPASGHGDFQRILMSPGEGTGDGDFIEAHIYGSIHRSSIKHVKQIKEVSGPDLVIWTSVKRRLAELGISAEDV